MTKRSVQSCAGRSKNCGFEVTIAIPVMMLFFERMRTVWLFTVSDLLTFVVPEALFGISGALSGSALTTNKAPVGHEILARLPRVLAWTWMNTFVFTLSNQSHPASIEEDRLNKPWRPLPSSRITLAQARKLLLFSIPAVLAICHFYVGAVEETMLLFCLTWMYNDLGGSGDNFIIRDFIIAAAFAFYGSGALHLSAGLPKHQPSQDAYIWLCVTGAVIFTTIPIQDLKDQEGDLARGRNTAPLVIGDNTTRYSLSAFILIWSCYCPSFWGNDWASTLALESFGMVIALRILCWKNQPSDRLSWKLWSAWLVALYALPFGSSRHGYT